MRPPVHSSSGLRYMYGFTTDFVAVSGLHTCPWDPARPRQTPGRAPEPEERSFAITASPCAAATKNKY